jgi:hypothetical protein
MTYLPRLNRIQGNTARALTRCSRSCRGRMGKLPDPYEHRRPVYRKDARLAREAREVRQAAGDD